MAKQLTAPGCIYSIVARVDTTIYSPDQTWILDVPAGQTDFIAETNEIIIPADAMMCQKKCQIDADLARVNVLGKGSGSLATFITRAIEQIVGKGNATVEYGDGKMTVVLTESVTVAQVAAVESLLDRMLPKDVVGTIQTSELPTDYIRLDFLESTGRQHIDTGVKLSNESEVKMTFALVEKQLGNRVIYGDETNGAARFTFFGEVAPNFYPRWDFANQLAAGTSALSVQVKYETIHNSIGASLNDRQVVTFASAPPFETGRNISLFGYTSGYKSTARVYSFSIFRNNRLQLNYIPALDSTGRPCMFDVMIRKTSYNASTYGSDFSAGLTMSQALNLANLPATGGNLTVSLPLETAFDASVQTALNTAAAKGWTIVVQYRESELTADYIEADFLESTGTQYIDTEYVPNNETGIYLYQLKTTVGDFVPMGCRNNMRTESRFYALRSMESTKEGGITMGFGWGVWWSVLPVIYGLYKTYTNYMNDRAVTGENTDPITVASLPFTPKCSIFMFAANVGGAANHVWSGRIYEAAISQGESAAMSFVPRLDPAGVPCMYDTVTDQNFYNQGSGSFILGFETTEKAAVSLSKLPIKAGGTLTVSLPAEAEDTATLVPAAIDIAKSRGWTIITQYRTN